MGDPTVYVPRRRAQYFFLRVRRIWHFAGFAIVALFDFFGALSVDYWLFFVDPDDAVSALGLFVLHVAAPMDAESFDGLR